MLNRVYFIGHVGKVKTGTTKYGDTYTSFILITSEDFKDKNTGEWDERSESHQLVAFGPCAEFIKQNVDSGDLLYIEGKNRNRVWKDGDEKEHYSHEVLVTAFPRRLPRFYTNTGAIGNKPITVPDYPLLDADDACLNQMIDCGDAIQA